MSEELKPCPFCGYKLTMQEGVCPVENCVDDETGQWHFTGICCPSCAVFLPKAEEKSSVYDGVKAWNARHENQMDGWIDVNDRLPGEQGHDSEEVSVFLNGHCDLLDNEKRNGGGWGYRTGWYDAERGCFRVHGRPDGFVTHWQPLPAPPRCGGFV